MTPLECGIIFDGIPEGAIARKVGLIWGIPVTLLPMTLLTSSAMMEALGHSSMSLLQAAD